MFQSETKKQEKMAKTARQWEEEQNLVGSQIPEHGEDEQWVGERDKERADLIRWQQDLSEEATNFLMELRGYYLNADGDWEKDPHVKPLANEAFIRRIRPLLVPSISRNVMMTNFSEDRILKILKGTVSEFTWLLFIQGEKYGVNKNDFSMLVRSFKAAVEPTYFRAMNSGERNYLNTIQKRVETFSDRPEQKKKTLFGLGG